VPPEVTFGAVVVVVGAVVVGVVVPIDDEDVADEDVEFAPDPVVVEAVVDLVVVALALPG